MDSGEPGTPSAEEERCLIRLRDVHFSYSIARPVLRGLDLDLTTGERVGLVGANGSGKSSLLQIIVGLLRPESGTVEVLGRERRKESDFRAVRGPVGLLFQDPDDQLFCPTVAEDVAFGPLNLGRSHDEAHATMHRTLRGLGLEGYEQRITYHLSGGEKRLVSLAAVLAMEPEVLLLDEPLGGLDVEARQRVADILRRLPMSMIVVSHDREFLESEVDRTLRLVKGRWG